MKNKGCAKCFLLFSFVRGWGWWGGGCGRSKQGALWGMGKWRIGQRPSNLVRNLPLATLHPTLMLHFSWFAYAAVMRIYKHYFFNLKDPSTGRFKNQFSFFAESTPCFPLDMPPFFYVIANFYEMLQLLLVVVIIKGYGVRATTIEGQNAFAPVLCFA